MNKKRLTVEQRAAARRIDKAAALGAMYSTGRYNIRGHGKSILAGMDFSAAEQRVAVWEPHPLRWAGMPGLEWKGKQASLDGIGLYTMKNKDFARAMADAQRNKSFVPHTKVPFARIRPIVEQLDPKTAPNTPVIYWTRNITITEIKLAIATLLMMEKETPCVLRAFSPSEI